jgi:hypothetical protein
MSLSESVWLYDANKRINVLEETICLRDQMIITLRAENLRMREALEAIATHQEIVAGQESSMLAANARIARSALSVRHHRRGECECELCEPPRRDV